ncbi:MAG: hypothetical protein KDF59_16330, partial [Nitrosomonas sp.]|nr:hypothetical protein [Nitrosomonas sp.]
KGSSFCSAGHAKAYSRNKNADNFIRKTNPKGATDFCAYLFNLESSVERVRVCGSQIGWQGEKRRMAIPCNDEQRSQTI